LVLTIKNQIGFALAIGLFRAMDIENKKKGKEE